MHRSKKKRNIIIFSLVGVLLCMVVGYAAFQTRLEIKGTSKVTSNWDIRITNVTEGEATGSAENTIAPKWDSLTATMEANLYEKGDAMEYDVTIENKGTIDAKLNDVLTNLENSNSDAVIITFSGYTKGEVLKAGSSKLIHVKIEYNPNYDGGETSGEIDIEFDYGQNNNEENNPDNQYLLTYDYSTNGGTSVELTEELVGSGTEVDLSNTATKEGWVFVGWNTNKDAKEGLTSYQMPEKATTLYAIYSKGIKVTYEKGDNIESIGKTEDTCNIYNNETSCEIILPEITVGSDYIVDGWYKGEEKVGDPNDKYEIKEDITLTSKAVEDTIVLSISTTATTNSITVVANATSPTDIVKYEYSIDGGKTWIDGGTNNTYTFTGLTQGTTYDVMVRATSESGKEATSTKETITESLIKPTYSEEGTTEKTVTVTYPSGCGSTLTCTYQKDNGEVVEVTTETVEVPFTEDGNIVGTVSDGISTVSSSYTVQLERTISIGTVKGGSITLDKETALLTENVNITSTATTDFAYKGATLVCEDGSTKTITGKTFNMSECNSNLTVYPTWKRNDRTIMQIDKVSANPTFSQVLVDAGGTGTYYNSITSSGHRYYLSFSNPQGSWSRVQMSTAAPIDLTDYSDVYISTWCYGDSKQTMVIGITKSRSTWMLSPNNNHNSDGGTHVAKTPITTNTIANDRVVCNISKYTGNWYIGIQRLYTNSHNSYYCNVNVVGLTGQTYSYANRGI